MKLEYIVVYENNSDKFDLIITTVGSRSRWDFSPITTINIPYLTWITSLAEANLPLGPRAPHFLSRTWRQYAVWPGLEP